MAQENDWSSVGSFVESASDDWSSVGSPVDAKPKKQNKGILSDLGTDVKRGVQQIPGAITGLADIPVAGITGRAYLTEGADALGGITGFKPGQWAKDAEAEYSPQRQAGRAEINKAWEDGTASDIAGAYLKNPMNTVGAIAESVPSMLVGGIAGRAALGIGAKVATKAAPAIPGMIARTVGEKMAPAVAAGIGEGGVMAGQAMQNSLDAGVDPREAAAYAAGTGIVGGAIGALGGSVAQRMGIIDPDIAMVGGKLLRDAPSATGRFAGAKELAKRTIGGGIAEGVLEELPQSVMEQGLSNLAQGKPITEGVARAGVEGALAGFGMGAAFNVLPGAKYAQTKLQERPPEDGDAPIAGLLPAPVYPGTPGDQIIKADAERQAAIAEADANAAKLYAERDAFEREAAMRRLQEGGVRFVSDPNPIQDHINDLLSIGRKPMTKAESEKYAKALTAAFNEPIGIKLDANQIEVPFTMGEYLDAQVRAGDEQRAIPLRTGANEQAGSRLTQLADEEAMQQPDIQSLPARQSITAAPAPQAPAIPVVGPLSAAANVAVQTGAAAPVQSITQPPAQAIAQQAQPVAAQTAAAEVTDDMRLDGKRAAYAANAATGAPDDVTSSVVMKWQRKTNERGEPMNIWRSASGALGLLPANQKSPFVNGELLGTMHPDKSTQPTIAGQQQKAAPAPVNAGPIQSAVSTVAPAAPAAPAQGSSFEGRTDAQLNFLAMNGRTPEIKASAAAELQRRGIVIAAPQASAPTQAAPEQSSGEIRRGKVGGKLTSGEVVLTSSGRSTTPFPKVSAGGNAATTKMLKAVDRWLMENAASEAESRGDKFNASQFSANAQKPQQADKDSAEEYLFGQQPEVPRPFLKPLVNDASRAANIERLQAELAAATPMERHESDVIGRLITAVIEDATKSIDAGSPPAYTTGNGTFMVIHPSAQNPGMVQVTRYAENGVFGDSQYNNIEEAIRDNGVWMKRRMTEAEAIAALDASAKAEADYQKRKQEPAKQESAKPLENATAPAEPKKSGISIVKSAAASPIAKRDDLVGAIIRVTGGAGIHSKMAQTIVGDKANAATKVRGLFSLRGQEDLGDIADLLRVQEGYDVRDGDHLSELIREQAAGNPVYSMGRTEREAAENVEKEYRSDIRRRATALGIRTAVRKFDDVERDVLEAETKQAQDEAQAERDAIQAADAVEELDDDQIDALIDLAAQETKERGRYINEEWITNEQILDAFDGTETLAEHEDAEGAARAGQADAGEAGGNRQERGQEARPDFGLAAQTLAEVRQQESDRVAEESEAARLAAQEAADKKAAEKKSLEDAIKARAANPDNFQFGEDAKAAAKPMGSLFDQPAPKPVDPEAQQKQPNEGGAKPQAGQRRAAAGGELGANGEWYEGGKFIANTDRAKGSSKWKKPTGKMLVDRGEFAEPPAIESADNVYLVPVFTTLSGVETYNEADNTFSLNPSLAADYATAEGLEERRKRIAGWNAGGRWRAVSIDEAGQRTMLDAFFDRQGDRIGADQAKPQRGEVGASLTKEERKSVLKTLVDVYRQKNAPREMKGVDANGNERYGYVHSPELFEKSDITGAMVRYHVTLPDGRIAHPTELFADYTQADIDAAMQKEIDAGRLAEAGKKSRAEKIDRTANADLNEARVALGAQYRSAGKDIPDRFSEFYSEAEGKWIVLDDKEVAERYKGELAAKGYREVATYSNDAGPNQRPIWKPKTYVGDAEQPKAEPAKYTGPADVSTRSGQMELANRGGRIAALKMMNEQLRKIAPDEAWADANIEQAADLDALQNSISKALVDAQRGKPEENPLRKELEELSGQELKAVFDKMGLAGKLMGYEERISALLMEDSTEVRAAIKAVAEPAKAQDDDWLNTLFGQAPSAEQVEKENSVSVKSAQDKADRVDAAIAMLSGEIEANNAAAAELAARKYKANRKQIELAGDGPGRNGSMSISAINESRKRRAIEASLNASSAIKKAIEFISENPDSAFKQVLDMESAVTKQFNEGFFGKSAKLDDQLDMAVGSLIDSSRYSGEGSAGNKLRMAARAYFADDVKEPADANAPADVPGWFTDIPETGVPLTQDQIAKKPTAYQAVVGLLAQEAWKAISQNQRTSMIGLYAYVKPAEPGYNGIVRLFPEDQTPPAPWSLLDPQIIRQGGMTKEQGEAHLRSILGRAPVIGEPVEEKAAPTEKKADGLVGNRRDPMKVTVFKPYEDGDIVTIDGKDWQVKNDGGWYLTSTGNWRGEHPTIKKVVAMTDLIREIEQAAAVDANKEPETKAAEQEAKSAEKIEDFGEKIAGAKKDLWQSYKKAMSDELPADAKDITLSKHFPEPDYENLIASGIDIRAVAAIKAMRDEIPAKPRQPFKLRRWAEQLRTLRDFSNGLISGDFKIDRVLSLMRSGRLSTIADRIEMYAELGYPAFKSADGYSVSGGWSTDFDDKGSPRKKDAWAILNRNSIVGAYDSRDMAMQALRERLAVEPEKSERSSKLDLYKVTSTGDIVIGKKVASNKFIDLKTGFKSAREARAYLNEHEAELLQLLEQRKKFLPTRRSTNDPRVGKDYRLGEDVTPEKFASEFGFRGVQFGNYVERARRVKDLNNAYDALLDLANIIGVPPRAISLNGSLGLAFGARGKGGVDPAAAHYESDETVINLTKISGAGSLGHEFFHALDNYFSKKRGQPDSYLTANQRMNGDGIRPEVVQAFASLMKTIKSSDFYKRSIGKDKTRSKDYWSTSEELAARAFESYLIAKAEEKGESNDYLANIISEEAQSVYNEMLAESGMDADPYPYPTKEEQKTINAAFDNLFSTLETKETGKGIALTEERAVYDVNEPGAFTGDIFQGTEHALPEAKGRAAPAGRQKRGRDENRQGASRVLAVRESETAPGTYNVTTQLVTVGERKLPVATVKTSEDAARAFAHLSRYAVEHFDGLVTDKNGKPLAVIGSFKGDPRQTSVYPSTVMMELSRIKGAANLWMSHNHPSGKADLSGADKMLSSTFRNILRDTNISYRGLSAIARRGDEITWTDDDYNNGSVSINEPTPYSVPIVEREIVESRPGDMLSSPTDAKRIVSALAKDSPGVVFATAQNEVGSFIPFSPEEMGNLRSGDRLMRLFGAAAKSGATTAIIAMPDGKVSDLQFANIRAALMTIEIGVLDGIKYDSKTGQAAASVAETIPGPPDVRSFGNLADDGVFFSQLHRQIEAAPAQNLSVADKAVYGMVSEGKSAADILKFIASASRNPFYRQLAKLLQKTGIAPRMVLDDQSGWKMNAGNDKRYAAAYNPKTDTVALFRAGAAERNVLHELTHAATIKALEKNGLAAAQMKALFNHVKNTGKLTGMYGVTDVDEFVAEAFSNPKFQDALKGIAAPPSSGFKSAWHWFVRVVRNILGVPANQESALIRALEIGVDVMRENAKIKAEAGGGTRYASGPAKQTETPEFKRWFGESKVVDSDGNPLVVYHGTASDITAFRLTRTGEFGPAIYTTADRNEAAEYGVGAGSMALSQAPVNVMPVYVSLQNPYTNGVEKFWPEFGRDDGDAAAVQRARDAGYDGVIATRPDWRNNVLTHYVAFDPTQIKSAIGNNGQFDPANPDIRYNVEDEGWSVSEPSNMDDMIYALQDKHIDTKRVIQAIAGAGRRIADAFNPYLKEELFHGRAAKGVKDFLDFELRPLLAEMNKAGVDMGDFEEFLWNRHAEERNRQIAKINPDMPDAGSGIKTADARAYMAGLPADQRAEFERLARLVDAINRKSQAILVQSGLEKPETINAWNAAYKKYVPLQREDVDSGHVGTGKGFSVRGSSSKRAMGSGRQVVDILANIAMQRERNVVRAEKNRVSNALLGLALENENKDFWTVDKAPKERVVKETAIYVVYDGAGNRVGDTTRMAEAERMARDAGGDFEQTWGDRVTERIEPGFKNKDNVILTRVNGEDHYITFNERNERAKRMAQALKNLDVDGLGRVLSAAGKATRYLASVNTQYNPVFGVINLVRDVQGALINLQSTELAGEQAKVLGYTKDALVGIYRDIRDHRAGRAPSSPWAQAFEEFQKAGGQTGYRDAYANAEQRAEAIKSELGQFSEGKSKKLARGLFGWLSDYNETMENAVRLAAYKVARDKGMSIEQAASIGKNLTVNFNRKGQVTQQVGALYAFFNASVQGTARIAQTLFETNTDGDPKKVRLSALGKKVVAGGVLLGAMQALLLAAAGYDDDEPPEFVKERSLILPIGDGKYLSLAMPLGFHVLPGIGRIGMEFLMSGGKDPLKYAASLAAMMANTFNPLGSAGLSLQTITPSVVDPLAALAENKDFAGREIYRESFNAMNPETGNSRARDVATPWSRLISASINYLTGGSEYRPGMFSPSPDAIDYLIGQATGGVGRELGKASQTATAIATGEDFPLYKVPLAGRFIGDTEGKSGESQKFYNNVREINSLEREYKGLLKDQLKEEAISFAKENPGVRLILAGNAAENQVRKLRSMKRDLVDRGADRETVRAVEDKISQSMNRFNEQVKKAKEKAA